MQTVEAFLGFGKRAPVEGITFDQIVVQDPRRPDAELSGFLGINAITDSNYDIEIMKSSEVLLAVFGS